MMPKEGMVCFIVFFDIILWYYYYYYLLWKNKVSISIIRKVMIILLILWWPFKIFRSKRILLEWQLYIGTDIIMGGYPCTIKNFISKNKATPMIPGPHWFYRQKYKKKTPSAPEYTRGPRQGDIFCPGVYLGAAFKWLKADILQRFCYLRQKKKNWKLKTSWKFLANCGIFKGPE